MDERLGRLEGDFGRPLSWLPRSVREAKSARRSIIVGWLSAFLPSLLLSALAQLLASRFPALVAPSEPQFPAGMMAIFALVIFAPLVETLIMGIVLIALLRFLRPTSAVILSAIGWGLAHSSVAPAWGLVIWWPFLIFSTLFVAWRKRGFGTAVMIVAAVHGFHNLAPALMLVIG